MNTHDILTNDLTRERFLVWYASERRIKSPTKLIVYDDKGTLSTEKDTLVFRGGKNTFAIPLRNIQSMGLARQTISWVIYLILIGAMGLEGVYLIHLGITPTLAVLLLLFAVAWGLIIGYSTQWVVITYEEQNYGIKKAYFAQGEKKGWGGIFGGTQEMYTKLKVFKELAERKLQ
jgi:hypothetical protein